MHAMPSLIPLSRTASITSSVMSRTASPPAVRNSVSRWKTFTATQPSSVIRATASPILRVRAGYVMGEPSVAGTAARGRLALGVGGLAAAAIAAAAGGQQGGECEQAEDPHVQGYESRHRSDSVVPCLCKRARRSVG